MSEQRLIPADIELSDYVDVWTCHHCGDVGNVEVMAVEAFDDLPTIDPDTLPIVQELREKLSKYEQAEKEGRLKELPCKIGDNIYVIPSKVNYELNKLSHPENNRVYKQTVSGVRIYNNNDYLLETFDGLCIALASEFKKTWFLTEEEAKATLQEREEK